MAQKPRSNSDTVSLAEAEMATLMNQLMFISFFLFFGSLSARLCLKSFVLAQQISALIRVELWVSLSLGLNYIIDPPPRAAPPLPCDPFKLELLAGSGEQATLPPTRASRGSAHSKS